MKFSRQAYCMGLPCPPRGDLPHPGIKPVPLASPALAGGFFTTSTTWEALHAYVCESESPSVMSDSLRLCGLYIPWNSPGQNTRVGSLSLFQGIFPTQGLNPGLLHCRHILYHLSLKGSPHMYTHTHTHTHTHRYIHIICVCIYTHTHIYNFPPIHIYYHIITQGLNIPSCKGTAL